MKDLDQLVSAFEKETTASGQRSVLAKIQHGLIAAQDIGDDKLVTVQAMSDLIENKARQLEHDSKILDFGKDDEDEPTPSSKSISNSSTNQSSAAAANTSSGVKNAQQSASKSVKEKDSKDVKPQVIKRRKKQAVEAKSRAEDRDDDAASTVSNRSGGGGKPRGNLAGAASAAGNKRQGVKRKSTGKRSSNFNDKDDSDREVDLSNIEIDPDEPTYCLCEQVCAYFYSATFYAWIRNFNPISGFLW